LLPLLPLHWGSHTAVDLGTRLGQLRHEVAWHYGVPAGLMVEYSRAPPLYLQLQRQHYHQPHLPPPTQAQPPLHSKVVEWQAS
jgi:hypothetical protein